VDKILAKVFLAGEAADLVLTNVAAHAAEALGEPLPIRKVRRPATARKTSTTLGRLRLIATWRFLHRRNGLASLLLGGGL